MLRDLHVAIWPGLAAVGVDTQFRTLPGTALLEQTRLGGAILGSGGSARGRSGAGAIADCDDEGQFLPFDPQGFGALSGQRVGRCTCLACLSSLPCRIGSSEPLVRGKRTMSFANFSASKSRAVAVQSLAHHNQPGQRNLFRGGNPDIAWLQRDSGPN